MKKVCITERNGLDERMLRNHPDIKIVDNVYSADFIISQSTITNINLLNKTIYIGYEPPRTIHRMWCYDNFDRMHTVFCYNPDPTKPNQFPFTLDDSSQYYITKADPYEPITREYTKFNNRGVFFAGHINIYDNSPDNNGGINITTLRKIIGNYILKEFPGSIVKGIGWFGQTTKPEDWRTNTKKNSIINSDCDFVLALENTIYPNYISEKIWDAFNTDRVALYLGDPRIEHHIPLNCFIDLRKYFDIKTKQFDLEGLGKRLREMTQEEYDEILNNARKFRETAKGKHEYYQKNLTQRIIDIILKD